MTKCAVCGNEATEELCDRCNGLLKLFDYDAVRSDELASDFGNWPGGISTNNRRVFRLSAGN